ncbi:YTH domain-containing protein [Plasmodium gonderi]|uniref:YTH domain-containing protein n=1 Tax=Plasmodium gonderi TaxID=77519 RepID=A0A1Y1JQA0_PLAGO|nr:YTH domain-containing protein [Plasmodium gonderi]GAW83022.1 YTH domain-containing protein [Plasmodium gonderi]
MVSHKRIVKRKKRKNLYELYVNMQEEKLKLVSDESRGNLHDGYDEQHHGVPYADHEHIIQLENEVRARLEEQSNLLSMKGIDRVDIQQKKGKHSIICIHYIKNMCMKNLFCNYLHQLIYAKIPTCKNFVKNNYCADKVRGSCMFRHTLENANTTTYNENKDDYLDDILKFLHEKNICVNYLLGFCNLGYNCRKSHKSKSRKFINIISILPKFYLDHILINHPLYTPLYSNHKNIINDMNKLKDALIVLSGEKYQEKQLLPISSNSTPSYTNISKKEQDPTVQTNDSFVNKTDICHSNSDTHRHYPGGGSGVGTDTTFNTTCVKTWNQESDQIEKANHYKNYSKGTNVHGNNRHNEKGIGSNFNHNNSNSQTDGVMMQIVDNNATMGRDNEKIYQYNRMSGNEEKWNINGLANRNQENIMNSIPNVYDLNNEIIESEKIKVFVIKCNQISHLYLSILYGVWATGKNNTRKFVNLFKENYTIIFLFSVNESGGFQGYAKMITMPIKNLYENLWGPITKRLGGNFRIQWIKIAKIDFDIFKNMVNPYNDNLPLKKSRDGTELPLNLASIICNKIHLLPNEDFLAGTIYEYKRRIKHSSFFQNLHKQNLLNTNTVLDMRIFTLNQQSDCENITFIDGIDHNIT